MKLNLNNTDNEHEILKFLRDRYQKKGMNYTFKCKKIAKKLDTNTYVIASYIPRFKKQGIVKMKEKTSNGIIYKTCFEKDEK